jgi:hypothetical protein
MDYELASENLKYCADTGILWWITSSRGRRAGKVAGSNTTIGGKPHYNIIGFQGKSYLSHRVAWLLFYKEWPDDQIDHINGNKQDNRIRNLRCVSQSENMKNIAISQRNTSGCLGVTWDTSRGKWKASIYTKGMHVNLGRFDNFSEAVFARKEAASRFGFHKNHGRVRTW